MRTIDRRQWIIIIAIIVVASAAFYVWRPPDIGPFAGNRLPPFTIMNRDGQQVAQASLADKPLLINFWATWCEPCRAEMPIINRVFKVLQDDLYVIAVTDEPLTVAERFFDEMDLSLPLYIDADRSMHDDYLIRFMPTTFFVGRNGVIESIKIGEMTDDMLLSHLQHILPRDVYNKLETTELF